MHKQKPASLADLSPGEARMITAIRTEAAKVAAFARSLAPEKMPLFVAERIERFTAPIADVSEEFATVVARLLSWHVQRLLTH